MRAKCTVMSGVSVNRSESLLKIIYYLRARRGHKGNVFHLPGRLPGSNNGRIETGSLRRNRREDFLTWTRYWCKAGALGCHGVTGSEPGSRRRQIRCSKMEAGACTNRQGGSQAVIRDAAGVVLVTSLATAARESSLFRFERYPASMCSLKPQRLSASLRSANQRSASS